MVLKYGIIWYKNYIYIYYMVLKLYIYVYVLNILDSRFKMLRTTENNGKTEKTREKTENNEKNWKKLGLGN